MFATLSFPVHPLRPPTMERLPEELKTRRHDLPVAGAYLDEPNLPMLFPMLQAAASARRDTADFERCCRG